VTAPIIDALQYCNWSEAIFRDLHSGGVAAVHATICYHESFRETVANIAAWNRQFDQFPDLIFQGFDGGDVRRAASEGRTAIFLGSQNPSCMEDDIGLVEILHRLAARWCAR
jgi:membrane dipeptidase